MMKNGEPCTLRDVSTVLEGVTPRPLTKGSMAWCFLPYELYTNMRYLQSDLLEQLNISNFDSWAANFAKKTVGYEITPDAKGFRMKTRFSKFYNLPELINLWKESADIQTEDMLILPTPKINYETETYPKK